MAGKNMGDFVTGWISMLCSFHRVVPRPQFTRGYAISVQPGKVLPGKRIPRVFKDKKAFQYNLYQQLLQSTSVSPLIFLYRDDFTANRLKKVRCDIKIAANKFQSTSDVPMQPSLTVVRSGVLGAALRDFPNVNLTQVEKMVGDVRGGFAVLSLPILDPPYLKAILRALDKSVPVKPPKTPAELQKELDEKKADPPNPGRRIKRVRPTLIPELRVMGALIEGKLLLPQGLDEVTKMPSLDTLRAQIVGLLSSPAAQLAGVLGQAGGGQLARTLQGLEKTLSERS